MAKYDPIAEALASVAEDEVVFEFSDIEGRLGIALPPSASVIEAWWANERTHSQSKAWMRVGWKVSNVNLEKRWVAFSRDGDAHKPVRPVEPAKTIQVSLGDLSAPALKLIEEKARQNGGDMAAAVVSIIDAAGLEHRKSVLAWFRANGSAKLGTSSADLIREDRDAR